VHVAEARVAQIALHGGYTIARKQKAPAEAEAKCLTRLVGRAGIEPATNGVRGGAVVMRQLANQQLAALANIEISVSKAQLRHIQCALVATGYQSGVSHGFGP
jgi:hypothetical protein